MTSQLYWSVNSFIIIIIELYIVLCYFITDIFTDFYVVDRYFVFLFSLFLWQYLQDSDTCNAVTS